jgi:hypothetical protein
MIGQDLYWGTTGPNGKTTIHHSRVWDANKFTQTRREEGSKAEKEEDRFIVSVHTKEEYTKENRK